MPETTNPLEGIIRLEWPGKQSQLVFDNERWRFQPYEQVVNKHALLFHGSKGNGENLSGISVIGNELSCLDALHTYVSGALQFVYYDAPRLNTFQSQAEPGYATSTWLSLVQQVARRGYSCLKRKGFIAIHTDDQMASYARVILDELFGRDCYVGTMVWQKQYGPQNDLNIPTDVFDYVVVYSKSSVADLQKIGLLVKPDDLKDDGDFRGCYIDGHKGARSGSEATKFHVNTSPYHWQIIDSKLPSGRWHFDPILGVIWFESVEDCGDFYIRVQVTDKNGRTDEKVISFTVREQASVEDNYSLPDRIWWLLKNDNDIQPGGPLKIVAPSNDSVVAIKGQEFSIVFQAVGGAIFSMRSDSPGSNRYWEFGLRTLVTGIAQAKASFGSTGNALPSIKKFFNREDAKKIAAVMNYLPWYDFGHTQDATQHTKALKDAGITEGAVNMMAKPQRFLAHLINLFAPSKKDIVMSLGDVNGAFASVSIKMNRFFIHMAGGSASDIALWENNASRRMIASLEGVDNESLEGSDALSEENPSNGHIDTLLLSSSYISKNEISGEANDYFDDKESLEDFWAGLAGSYRISSSIPYFTKIDGTIVVVVSSEQPLDIVMIDRLRKQYPSQKLVIIYESSEGELTSPRGVFLKRAPFELI